MGGGRPPLILAGGAGDRTELYRRINALIPTLVPQADEKGEGDYWVDLKMHNVTLSEAGHERAEELMTQAGLLPAGASLYHPPNIIPMHHPYARLRAPSPYPPPQHYVVINHQNLIPGA